MRVIGGSWGGRRLLGPPRGAETRPTSDKVREAVFNFLGARVQGARTLDLFAGTGAMGIEALSRGAAHADFLEIDRGLCQTIQTNLETVEAPHALWTIHRRDVRRALKQLKGPWDLVFIDPPYGHLLEREALVALAAPGLLAPGATVVVECASRESFALPAAAAAALEVVETREYGDTSITRLQRREEVTAVEAAPASETPTGRVAIYAGSFDPPTNGHLDIIRRASRLFDRLIIAVASNVKKAPLFSQEERIALLREVVGDDPRVEVDRIDGLLVDYARARGATAVIRGLRAVADFEYEFQMACMNHHLAPAVETVFLMTAQEYFYVSSSLVKEVASFGGDVAPFVPATVLSSLHARFEERRAAKG
jgi:pantetheine-phosphate adenylyltransferase